MTDAKPSFHSREAHAKHCGWHFEEYPWECDCGARERLLADRAADEALERFPNILGALGARERADQGAPTVAGPQASEDGTSPQDQQSVARQDGEARR